MSLANNTEIWRFKVITRADDWIEFPGKYEYVQEIAYSIYQSLPVRGDRCLPTSWQALMAGQGENWPWMIDCTMKRLAIRWKPFQQARMRDGQSVSALLLQELQWMRNDFAIPLVIDAGGKVEDAYPLIGDIMLRYLRVLGDVVETYVRDEQEFV